MWEPQRDEREGVGEIVGRGTGGVVGCLWGSSVVGEILLCSLRSPSPHNVCNYSYDGTHYRRRHLLPAGDSQESSRITVTRDDQLSGRHHGTVVSYLASQKFARFVGYLFPMGCVGCEGCVGKFMCGSRG